MLDDDHRRAAAQADQRVHHLLHDRGRQALERLVQQDQLGSAPPAPARSPASAARRPTGSPPARAAARAAWGTARRSRRTTRRPGAWRSAGSPSPSGSGTAAGPPGTIEMPRRLISYGRACVMSAPSIVIRPALVCTVPVIARSIVVLPTPLRPSSATASPSCTDQIEIRQHQAAGIAGAHLFQLQQRLRRDGARRSGSTPGCGPPARAVPI